MRRIIVPSLTAALVLAFSAAAAAEGNDAKKGGVVPLGATTVPEPVPATQTETTTSGEAARTATAPTPEAARNEARLKAIRDRAAKMPATDREEIQKNLEGNIKDVDVEAVANGDATVADRFAAEFGVTSEVLLAERTQYNVGWGEVMIAHTLLANAPSGTTIDMLYALHADGMGWGQVAYGMGLRVGSVAAAVKTETMVARGTMKADGKPAKIGANTRVATSGGAHSGAGQARAGAASSAALGTGAKITK